MSTREKIPKKVIKKDLKRFKDIDTMAKSAGGIEVRKLFLTDLRAIIEVLAYKHKELSHIELVANCAALKERLSVFNLHCNAEINVKITEDALREILKEDPDDLEEEV